MHRLFHTYMETHRYVTMAAELHTATHTLPLAVKWGRELGRREKFMVCNKYSLTGQKRKGQKRENLDGDLHGCLQTRQPAGLLPAPGLPAEVLPLAWQQHPEILLGFMPWFPVGSGSGEGRRRCPAWKSTPMWAACQALPRPSDTTSAPSLLLLPLRWGQATSIPKFITSWVLNPLWCNLLSYWVLPLTSAASQLLQLHGKFRINRTI